MLKAVIFDMDGVILDSERLSRAAWIELAEEKGFADIDSLFTEAMGHSVDEITAMFLERYGFDDYPGFQEEVFAWNREHTPGGIIPLREGVPELLDLLKENGILIGLATATDKAVVEKELGAVGVLEYFDTVIAGDMVRRCKPDPEIYLKACEQLGVRPEESYGVEDGKNGILALHAAGIPAVMAEDQYHPSPEIAALCETVLPTLEAVREYFSAVVLPSGSQPECIH